MPHIIVGTAGHIDHGKTALVKALTGIDADRLKEEKERGITIDIGFANLKLDDGTQVGFVDVPGHERFVKNMLAGVGGIDLVMLVIAADESVMPQTREHLDICSLLEIRHGFTVMTKVDAVEAEIADLVELEIRDFLRGSFLEKSPIVRVSSLTRQGLPELTALLAREALAVAPRDTAKVFRLPVDRCFTMKGFGTVVTGTLIAGEVRKDDEVEILPGGKRCRVRGVQVHGELSEAAQAGQRTALNLQGIEVADVERGMTITAPATFQATPMFDCHFQLLPGAPGPIEGRKRIRFHTGTAELMGYVVLLDRDKLEPGGTAFVQIRLEEPAFALPGDRFIVRQYSPMITIGGGQILDVQSEKHRLRDPVILDRLAILKSGTTEDRLERLVRESAGEGMTAGHLVERLGLPIGHVQKAMASLVRAGRLRLVAETPATAVAEPVYSGLLRRFAEVVEEFHKSNPLVPGLSREELKSRAAPAASTVVFERVLNELLAAKKLAAAQEVIQAYGRTITLGGEELAMRSRLEAKFRELGLKATAPDDVIELLRMDRLKARKLIQLLAKDGLLVKINEELTVHREALDRLISDVRGLKEKSPKFGVGEFKDLTGVSRKFAIPLLEYLDRQRVTRRVGEDRLIL